MMSFKQFLAEKSMSQVTQYKWNGNPTIGWWKDRKSMLFYHGTHERNLESMVASGIRAPTSGPTANWVSLAIEPNTAFGYASMGGEAGFRAAGAKAVSIPPKERVVLVLKIPMEIVLDQMNPTLKGNMDKSLLTSQEKYDAFKGSDQEYYATTEIQFPKIVDSKYIIGYMRKK